ncbi:EamA/RhaT family transporter [Bordetella sp. BOR01]|uniref:EamA/RhaT family transporter n=1 Tax=Bordetella sp. BOR01 TaxID=2854779 RepID=UPI001C4822F2|nr:EamA/RhaT family transporter [Bordetella sp. BOR01]MBV7484050.1 EamA/RhaT family transporter [Bordetella sp. BOR01]
MTPGLLYLLASVGFSVSVAVLLKLARRYGIDVRQAIAANYAVTAALSWLMLRPSAAQLESASQAWGLLLALGVLLPCGFMAMAQSVRHAGIVRSDAAQRLSLFLPLLAAFLLFGEAITLRKAGAIALAFTALFCVLRRREPADAQGAGESAWLWPLGVWVAYGVVDILFKQVAKAGAAFSGALLIAFALAGVFMAGYLLTRRIAWQPRHLLAGVVLGVANFGNIVTYIRAHQALPDNPALVFSTMNMGVIALGTMVGALAFREPLSHVNLLGLVLAVAAILLMLP